MSTIRLTMAQALVRYLIAQRTETPDGEALLFAGIWAIFGHGNVAGLGEALFPVQDELPTYRAHNEQAMAHAAIAFAKANRRRRMMACTSSIGPGATNMVTAAAVAHVNRLPVLFLPGDVFANRRPDPVLQQIEDFGDPTVTANDCFKPVSRYWDRITRPEQIITSLPRAIAELTDPADCGPVTLSLCQDVQAEAYDFPEIFFEPTFHQIRRPEPDRSELRKVVDLVKNSQKPILVAGGGVIYSGATDRLAAFATAHAIPVVETQAGKGALPWEHEYASGAVGVTGSAAANTLAADADLVIGVGTRLQDFTTASRSLFAHPQRTLVQLNVAAFDAAKHGALPLVCDAERGLAALDDALGNWSSPKAWQDRSHEEQSRWIQTADEYLAPTNTDFPSDAQVLGAVNRMAGTSSTVVCAAGGLPGELHKLWRPAGPGSYHVEYGYSCMGYEIAGGLGVKMAHPEREIIVLLGDGSYLMLNSEIATSVMLGLKLMIVVLDNRGFGCINRLQKAVGGEPFNNLLADARQVEPADIDFAAHAASLGAWSCKVSGISELETAFDDARQSDRTAVIAIETDPLAGTAAGGAWWDVAVPEVSSREQVRNARTAYETAVKSQRIDG